MHKPPLFQLFLSHKSYSVSSFSLWSLLKNPRLKKAVQEKLQGQLEGCVAVLFMLCIVFLNNFKSKQTFSKSLI